VALSLLVIMIIQPFAQFNRFYGKALSKDGGISSTPKLLWLSANVRSLSEQLFDFTMHYHGHRESTYVMAHCSNSGGPVNRVY